MISFFLQDLKRQPDKKIAYRMNILTNQMLTKCEYNGSVSQQTFDPSLFFNGCM